MHVDVMKHPVDIHTITRFTALNVWLADLYAPLRVDLGGLAPPSYHCDTVR